jgi:hypothetical protein
MNEDELHGQDSDGKDDHGEQIAKTWKLLESPDVAGYEEITDLLSEGAKGEK